MEKACTIGKPLIYFNSETQTWWACYDSRYHKDGSLTAACDILDVLNKGVSMWDTLYDMEVDCDMS